MPLAPLVLDQVPGLKFTLQRIEDPVYEDMQTLGVKVANARTTLDIKILSGTRDVHYMNLAEFYATMSRLFGPSGNRFDPVAGSFSFPFCLTVAKNGKEHDYMIHVCDSSGIQDILFYRLFALPGYPNSVAGLPVESEFSRRDIKKFIALFYGFLLGHLDHIRRRGTAPFVRGIPARRILYGFLEGDFFEERFPSPVGYESARRQRLRLLHHQQAAIGLRTGSRPFMELSESSLKLMIRW